MSKRTAVASILGKPILRVYTGRAGCACGCRGSYSGRAATISRVVKAMSKYPHAQTDLAGKKPTYGLRANKDETLYEIDGCCFAVDYETSSGVKKNMTAYYDNAE